MEQKFCPVCKLPIFDSYIFCPNCGAKIREVVFTISVGKQISVYLISVLLPPLGVWPGIKYLLNPDEKAKKVGLIAIILTVISSIITIWMTISVLNGINKSLGTQLNQQQIQQLGL